jgi:hypothetical protein
MPAAIKHESCSLHFSWNKWPRGFQTNAFAFERFIQSIQCSAPSIVQPQIQPESPTFRQPVVPRREATENSPQPARLEIKKGDPFWLALIKGFGEGFILILLATIATGVGKWLY